MENIKKSNIATAMILLIVAMLSIFVVSKFVSSPDFHAKSIEALEQKRTTVMQLTAASTAASAAITLLPGDTATPIAEKLADLSTYFLIVICAIYLEKFLLTITGYVTFTFLIPAACLCLAIGVFAKHKALKALALKLCVFGMAIVLVIPTSVKISNLIENTYSSSIATTLETAKQSIDEIEQTAELTEDNQDKGLLSGLISKVTDSISNAVTGVSQKMENVLNNFIEALAVMLVTSCIIPILVILFFVWLIKLAVGVNVDLRREYAIFKR